MTRGGPIVVVGDSLLDRDLVGRVDRLCPDMPVPVLDDVVEHARPGGAGLAAVLATGDWHTVVLVTALSSDPPGQRLKSLLVEHGIEVVDLTLDGATVEKVRVGPVGHPLVRLDLRGPGLGSVGPLGRECASVLATAAAVLVSDYGQGVTAVPSLREALAALPRRTPLVWDPHPRGTAPVPEVRLATPNAAEAGLPPLAPLSQVTAAAGRLRDSWGAAGVAVTMGARGALYVEGGGPALMVPATRHDGGSTCGAGDHFAATAVCLLAGGALPSEAVVGAVTAASAFVAAGGAPGLGARSARVDTSRASDPFTVAEAVRKRGGTVVATGGCFDILHAGHLTTLTSARALGDCLIVLLNSDESVRRLKGPTRPLQPVEDRAAILRALSCVDGVVVFEEDTCVRVLEKLRPDIFAKGADYSYAPLLEAPALASWGGQALTVGRRARTTTTQLMAEIVRRATAE